MSWRISQYCGEVFGKHRHGKSKTITVSVKAVFARNLPICFINGIFKKSLKNAIQWSHL